LDATVNFINTFGNELSILQCTTSYPTPPERVGLNVITELKQRYPNHKIGLSEHTARTATSIAAVALGAELLEFHAIFDRRMFGPDASSSLTIDEVTQLVADVRFVESMLLHPVDKTDLKPYESLKKIFEKTLAVTRDLPKGHLLKFEDLEAKKPANQGVSANDFRTVLGRALKVDKRKYDFLQATDLI